MLSDAETRAYESWEDTIRADMVVARIHGSKAVDTDTTVFVGEQVVLDDLRAKFPIFPMPFNKPKRQTTIIAKAPGMGLGMFATRELRVGETVVHERPLLFAASLVGDDRLPIPIQNDVRRWHIRRAFNNQVLGPAMEGMSASNREVYSKLSKNFSYYMSPPPEFLDVYPDMDVFAANSFTVEKPMAGRYKEYRVVARDASRINHRFAQLQLRHLAVRTLNDACSCSPNATWEFHESTFTFIVKISRDIPKGGQIFVSYCSLEYPRSIRQAILSMYSITPCTCKGCHLNEDESDARRSKLGAFLSKSSPVGSLYRTVAGLPRHLAFYVLLRLKQDIETEGLELMPYYPLVLYIIGRFWDTVGKEHKALEMEKKADVYFDLIGVPSFKQRVVDDTRVYASRRWSLIFIFSNWITLSKSVITVVIVAVFAYVVRLLL